MSENMEKWRHLDGASALTEQPLLRIVFQHGNPDEVGLNGVTLEEVIEVVIQKLLDFQGRDLACLENAVALWHLEAAKDALCLRRKRRVEQGVLGTKEPHENDEISLSRPPMEEFPVFSS